MTLLTSTTTNLNNMSQLVLCYGQVLFSDNAKQQQKCQLTKVLLFHSLVPSQPNRLDFTPKLKLDHALIPFVIPDNNLVRRVLWVFASTHKGQIVAAEQHLDYTDPSIFKL